MQAHRSAVTPPGVSNASRPGLRTSLVRAGASLTALVLASGLAEAQLAFGKDYQGPTQGLLDGSATKLINEGDVLRTSNPGALPAVASIAPPTVDIDSGVGPPPPGIGLALAPLCTAPTPGVPCLIEVDALSHGKDSRLDPLNLTWGGNIWFSVDEFAVGIPGLAPDVASESAVGDAAADVFIDNGVTAAAGPPPWCPMAIPISHIAALDGDGLVSGSGAVYPGLGLIEPTAPGVPPDPGDNLDCLDVHATQGSFPVWFSLDSGFLDPINGTFNSGSAAAHGFAGGDVLFSAAGGPPVVWAPAFALGLNNSGADEDDVDALILWDNGNGTYDPVTGPYSWISSGTDMLIYSVRRGSRIIGVIDSFCGVPIEEGDLLIPPPSPGMTPMIFIAAEALGLATVRSHGVLFGDDLDAADSSDTPLMDCNGNGQEDSIDIFLATSQDLDQNGVPDECQPYFTHCFCNIPGDAPCGNNAAVGEGCRNSLGYGAILTASGSNSIAQQGSNRLLLHASQGRPNKNCVWLQGGSTVKTPFKDGLLCMGNPTIRLPGFGCHLFPIQTLDATGSLSTNHTTYGFSIIAMALCKGDNIAANVPTTRHYQLWYRDGMGPCNTGSNLTNAVQVNWVP